MLIGTHTHCLLTEQPACRCSIAISTVRCTRILRIRSAVRVIATTCEQTHPIFVYQHRHSFSLFFFSLYTIPPPKKNKKYKKKEKKRREEYQNVFYILIINETSTPFPSPLPIHRTPSNKRIDSRSMCTTFTCTNNR